MLNSYLLNAILNGSKTDFENAQPVIENIQAPQCAFVV